MKKQKKKIKNIKGDSENSTRFWFTAPADMSEKIISGAAEMGLFPYEYIRILIHKALKG